MELPRNFTHILTLSLMTIVFLNIVSESHGTNVNKDLSLTKSELNALIEFKELVGPKLQKEHQKKDIYLIRWLRARNFNIQRAEEMLMQLKDLKWRKEKKMDTIHEEDWSDFEDKYPYQIDGIDNEGKPTNFDEWDLRRGVLSGDRDKVARWVAKAFDKATIQVRELQTQGENVTQWDFIINMNNFNLFQHGCLQCLPIFVTVVADYETHFPGMADKIILLNTPQIFEVVLNLLRPVMSQQTKETLKVYGNNKNTWESILFSDIERNQLPKEFGGTKTY